MSTNPFTSDWLRTDLDERLRPQRGLSDVAGLTDDPLRFITLSGMLDETVAAHGGRDAAFFAATGRRWSWHDLKARSDEVAAGLLALGLEPGDRVGLWAPLCEEWLGVQFAAARIGAILVNLNPAWGEIELAHALATTRCRALVMARIIASRDCVALLRGVMPEIDRLASDGRLHGERLPRLRHVVLIGDGPTPQATTSFKALRRLAGPAQRSRLASVGKSVDPDDPADIQFTSGAIGASKAATLTHYGLANNAHFAAQAMRLTEHDRMCIAAPVHHWFGTGPGIFACVASGAAMVIPALTFDATKTLEVIDAQGCTALHATPAMFTKLLEHPALRDTNVSTLRTGITAGGACPPETVRRIASELHMPGITIGYGKSETSPLTFQSDAVDPLPQRAVGVGRVHPHVEAKIVDRNGRIVPVGQSGELCVRGYLTMRWYWGDPEATRSVVDAAGWLRTGDSATVDADGYLRIVGRVGVSGP